MLSGRRTLAYATFDELMPDIERLLKGHATVDRICRHPAVVLGRHADLPPSTAFEPSDRVSEYRKRRMLESGTLPTAAEEGSRP